jgi:hypothetical protein
MRVRITMSILADARERHDGGGSANAVHKAVSSSYNRTT